MSEHRGLRLTLHWKPGQVCQEAEIGLVQLSPLTEKHVWPYWKKRCLFWFVVAGTLLMEKLQRLPDLQRHNWLKCNLLVGVFVQ